MLGSTQQGNPELAVAINKPAQVDGIRFCILRHEGVASQKTVAAVSCSGFSSGRPT